MYAYVGLGKGIKGGDYFVFRAGFAALFFCSTEGLFKAFVSFFSGQCKGLISFLCFSCLGVLMSAQR